MNIIVPEIIAGLLHENKYISSKFFYDDKGSELFKSITLLPEYYLTKSEYEIIENQAEKIIKQFETKKINIIEFGSGDGIKTKLLINKLLLDNREVTYTPIDISLSALDKLRVNFNELLTLIEFNPVCGDYFDSLKNIGSSKESTNVLLFMGSNIGNYNEVESIELFRNIYSNISEGSYFLIGFDLKKNPITIYNAYNDSLGITKAFNMNLLLRINREYDANFEMSNFTHFPTYNPESGEMKSYLISLKKQIVNINKLNLNVNFEYAEPIFTEVSRKFEVNDIINLSIKSDFRLINNYFDCKMYFCISLMKK